MNERWVGRNMGEVSLHMLLSFLIRHGDWKAGRRAWCWGSLEEYVVGITCTDRPDIWCTTVRIYCITRTAIASFGCAKHEVD